MLGIVVAGGLTLVAWNAPWVTATLKDGGDVTARGADAAPALNALALAGIALAGALSLAPRILRYVLGALQTLLGAGIVAATVPALADPVLGAEKGISALTGVAGTESVRALVASTALSFWPAVAIVGGVLAALSGIVVLVTARRWPDAGRRYANPQAAPTQTAVATASAADEWDALTRGTDPTR